MTVFYFLITENNNQESKFHFGSQMGPLGQFWEPRCELDQDKNSDLGGWGQSC